MSSASFNTFQRAGRHAITLDRPAIDFFSGALLGNGGLGAVVVTRPDALVLRLGHNNVWDQRIAENHADKIGTFRELFDRFRALPPDVQRLREVPWVDEYFRLMRDNYDKPYPRPFPCGSVLLGWDRLDVELLGHRLDIATGRCTVHLLHAGRRCAVEIFCDMKADRLWLRSVDDRGKPAAIPFTRVRLIPDEVAGKDLPMPECHNDDASGFMSFRQVLPRQENQPDGRPRPGDPADKAVAVAIRINGKLEVRSRRQWWDGNMKDMDQSERAIAAQGPLWMMVELPQGNATDVPLPQRIQRPAARSFDAAAAASRRSWASYWSRSGVAMDDDELEAIWYRNLYFLNCSVRPGVTCPGLFANWSHRNIGTAWHGDYHMNYNTQQPFWVTFSSNHVDKHLPYTDLVDHLLPVSRKWAREYYGMRGAYFPHSAYPTPMAIMPYAVPNWGWEVCETPWTVQSLWWHYLHTLDRKYLKQRALGPITEAVEFLIDYLKRPEARGSRLPGAVMNRWDDDHYHVFPTVSPELHGLRPGFSLNDDCLVDLTLIRFVFNAFIQACDILGLEQKQKRNLADVRDILEHLAPYPTADHPRGGKVFVSVPGEDPLTVYNTPNSIMTVFPGEDHGLHSPPDVLAIARRSYELHYNEGGNDLVFHALQGARLGMLDLEAFKRQVHYCTLPNGTAADMVMQPHGRYGDSTPFDLMAGMGIWFENFALPAVINECLLQSYHGELRLFPNWPANQSAQFDTLRAVGAFLVSAAIHRGKVQWLRVVSEAGASLNLINPWRGAVQLKRTGKRKAGTLRGQRLTLQTRRGETLIFSPLNGK